MKEDDDGDADSTINMSLLEFCKMCQPYKRLYQNIFGYTPSCWNYKCTQEEYFNALIDSIERKCELSALLPKRVYDYPVPQVKY